MTETLIAGVTPPSGEYDADIVILAMDRVDETLEAIQSALSQQGVAKHVLVYDQGSNAENLQRLAEFVRGREGIGLYRAAQNWGVAGGRNRASALGHGGIIIALDNDAEFGDPGTVAHAARRLGEEDDLASIGFRIVIHASGADDLSSWGYSANLLGRSGESFETVTFVGAGHAIRRAAWDQCGGYDDALFFCWEEYDFCMRAISKGWRMRYDGDLVIRHKVSPDRRFNWSGTRWFYYVRNRLYIGHKWHSWASLAPRTAGYLVKGARHGLWSQTLRAIPAAWRMGRGQRQGVLSPDAAAYLLRNDSAHRGKLVTRLKREVFAALPGHGMKESRPSAVP